jgi:hypothetical protein
LVLSGRVSKAAAFCNEKLSTAEKLNMNRDSNDAVVTIDALLPREMAARAERIGGEKTRLDTQNLFSPAPSLPLVRCLRRLRRPGPTAFCRTDSLGSSPALCFRLASFSSSSVVQSFLLATT